MKALVDEDRCRGHGVCVSVCPEVFDLSDDGFAVVRVAEIDPAFETAAQEAERTCPERAIRLE
ncbi:ferredoxin [Cryptosporangium minutisporangium]|uniref:Ferredoxin n=1 Tax=Cryptosporangium minutisporangium TaxID=113569 RepID=A0ABP6SUN1_9ACTN